ncbi:MAG: septum formation family protein [Chloroflexi bacterium]|nr:septum formation family protein [Chloroflexota bacterium]
MFAQEGCLKRFERFVGISYERSQLEVTYLSPTAVSWQDGDRRVQCVLHSGDGEPLTGSMRGRGE